uniref:EamA domain-containing protein n=1 Tax=Cystobacter fuscus TaxID=43 RepID=A0A3S7UY73_9BACT|nr:hypothetical protein [Cystobacter fuscus]
MLAGVLIAIVVNFIWGLAFLLPYVLPSVDPITITAGRYGSYGVLSIVLLLLNGGSTLRGFTRQDWLWVLALAFAGNVGYYALLVSAIQLGGVSIAAMIVGTLPVTMAIYGNWRAKELDLSRLLPALVFILGGLFALNGYKFSTAPDISQRLLSGTGCAVLALALWTWYGVQNARYLKRRPEISGAVWSGAIGVGTLVLMLCFFPLLIALGMWSPSNAMASLQSHGRVWDFIIASLLLGIVVSWLATLLWNIAARRLPVALAAQLIVFETISSVLYASIVDRTLPSLFELSCIAAILFGVLLGIRAALPKPQARPRDTASLENNAYQNNG